jgi:hypothetical protein
MISQTLGVFIVLAISAVIALLLVFVLPLVLPNQNKSKSPKGIYKSVRVCALESLNLNSPPTSIDGVDLQDGDRVLLRRQAETRQNGIWIYRSTKDWTRAPDLCKDEHVVVGNMVLVLQGNEFGGRTFTTQTIDVSDYNNAAYRGISYPLVFEALLDLLTKVGAPGEILTKDKHGHVSWQSPQSYPIRYTNQEMIFDTWSVQSHQLHVYILSIEDKLIHQRRETTWILYIYSKAREDLIVSRYELIVSGLSEVPRICVIKEEHIGNVDKNISVVLRDCDGSSEWWRALSQRSLTISVENSGDVEIDCTLKLIRIETNNDVE